MGDEILFVLDGQTRNELIATTKACMAALRDAQGYGVAAHIQARADSVNACARLWEALSYQIKSGVRDE